MKNDTYVLTKYNKPIAIITSNSIDDLIPKTCLAIKEDVSDENEIEVSVGYKNLGDWGEETPLAVQIIDRVTDDIRDSDDGEFSLHKIVSY